MKNLFSNILNKKPKEIINEEKEELNLNVTIEKSKENEIKKERGKQPTGQATEYLNKFILHDYKGNIIPEHLLFVYIPGKGSWSVDQFKRTLFDEYHEKRDQIPKPRLYLFNIKNSQSNIKSNAIKPMISKNNIILDNDVIKLNFESKRQI